MLIYVIFLTCFIIHPLKSDGIGLVVNTKHKKVFDVETFDKPSTSVWNISDDHLQVVPNGDGHVLQPEVDMSGHEWRSLSCDVVLPGDCPSSSRLSVSFSVLVKGYNENNTEDKYYSSNPGLKMYLVKVQDPDQKKLLLADIATMNVEQNTWSEYQVQVLVTLGARYQLEIALTSGLSEKSLIQLDGIVIEYTPVLGSFYESSRREEALYSNCTKEAPTTSTTVAVVDTTTTTATKSPIVEENNGTESSDNSTVDTTELPKDDNKTVSEKFDDTTVTSTTTASSFSNFTDSPVVETNTTLPINGTTLAATDTSMYGYSGEIVLICLTVLFLVLFVIMAVKYHRLKSRFGGYDVDPRPNSGSSHDNPAYDVQMSYRVGDT